MSETVEGRCTCGGVRYRLTARPIFVHCCHCTWCQRETGSAFVLNAMIETENMELLAGVPVVVDTPSNSGRGQRISRCPTCQVAVWSNYGRRGDLLRFVRVGTLEEPARVPPDVHIFTSTKQPWVILPDDTPRFEAYYDRKALFPPEALARWTALFG